MTLLKPYWVFWVEDYDNKEDPKYPLKHQSAEVTSYFNLEQNMLNELRSTYNKLNKDDANN